MGGGGDMLADLTGCPNEKANAFLFAASPKLLEMCKEAAVAMAGTDWPTRKRLLDVIAEIEGETK
jgi:hypothetical protein